MHAGNLQMQTVSLKPSCCVYKTSSTAFGISLSAQCQDLNRFCSKIHFEHNGHRVHPGFTSFSWNLLISVATEMWPQKLEYFVPLRHLEVLSVSMCPISCNLSVLFK